MTNNTITVRFTVPEEIEPADFLASMVDDFYYSNQSGPYSKFLEKITYQVLERESA
jgi:hypothetical protein